MLLMVRGSIPGRTRGPDREIVERAAPPGIIPTARTGSLSFASLGGAT
jgi:hypothetical protein